MSLAIPCFNGAGYIQEALDSVFAQTLVPAEILVIDDGSTDNSTAIVKQYPQVRLITHNENRGIAGARNSAIAAATGDVVVFLDADGIADPRFVEKLLACYDDGSVGGAGGKGIEAIQNNICDRWRKEVLFQHWGEAYRDSVPFLFGLCSSYRKNALTSVNGFDNAFTISGEDMDVGFRLNAARYQLRYCPEAMVYHQRSDNRQSIKRMAYRHCLYGFLAQRKNNNFANKVSTLASVQLYLRHVFLDGLVKGRVSYAALSTQLHCIMAKAWLDAKRLYKRRGADKLISESIAWEGHSRGK